MEGESEQNKKSSNRKKFTIVFIIVAGLLFGGVVYELLTYNQVSTDDAAIEAHVVPISPKVSGYITKVNVIDNQPVKAGDILVEIDQTDYLVAVDQAMANLEAAKAKLSGSNHSLRTTKVSAPSNVDSARSQVAEAEANWQKAAADLRRYRSMSNEARSRQQLDEAVAAEKSARSAIDDAKAKYRSSQTAPQAVAMAEANVRELAASVKKAEADLAEAEENLRNTKIFAPFSGRVTRKSAELGYYVQPGQQLMAIVSDDYWVVANFKETQLKKMKPGQEVKISIDAYPGKSYKGKVDSIQGGTGARFSSFPPENATGNFVKIVQRVPVKILFTERPDAILAVGPGMSVEPTVYTK